MKIEDLNEIINNRVKTRKKNSYTNKLLKLGPKKIAQKFGEESSELIIDFLKGSKKRTIEEAVDVICLLYTSPSPRDRTRCRMPSSA